MLTLLVFLGVLAVLVLVHELGHFLAAKANGIRVLEFGFGFPPRLVGVRKGETLYSINLVPLGGFVKLAGETDLREPGSLASKSAAVRTLVLSAGPLMNALLPVLLFTVVFIIPQQTVVGRVVIREVASDSPAQLAGIQSGDVVLKAHGRTVENAGDLGYLVQLRLGAEMEWLVQRGERLETARLVPRWRPPEGQGATGVGIQTQDMQIVSRSYPFWEAIPLGARRTVDILVLAKNEVTKWIIGTSSPQVAGPVGIAQMTGEVAQAGFLPLLEFTALLSINLAILNILPIPMLDGGRLVFVGLEWVRRGKRIPPEKEGLVHLVGFALLITLVVVITYFD
ncbi:MAG: RIP metalloprotease, partial [Dehalococcoidia bacterium]